LAIGNTLPPGVVIVPSSDDEVPEEPSESLPLLSLLSLSLSSSSFFFSAVLPGVLA